MSVDTLCKVRYVANRISFEQCLWFKQSPHKVWGFSWSSYCWFKRILNANNFFIHLYYGCVQNIPTTIQNLWKISSLINFEDISKIHNKLGKNETWCGDYLDHFKRNFVVIATCLEEFRYFGPYFVTCLLILYVKSLHFSCGVS